MLINPTTGLNAPQTMAFRGPTLAADQQRAMFRRWSTNPEVHPHEAFVGLAGSADHEGLASPFRHELGPRWLWSSRLGEVGESADVVHVHLGPLLAELTAAHPDPGDELLALAAGRAADGEAVDQDRHLLPP